MELAAGASFHSPHIRAVDARDPVIIMADGPDHLSKLRFARPAQKHTVGIQGSVFVTVFCFALMEPGCVTSDAMDRRTGNTCDGVARAGIGVGSFASRWPRGEPGACCPVDCYGSRLPRPLLARPVGMQPCVTQVSVVIMKAREVGRRNMYRASRTCADAFFTRGHQLRIFININRCRRFHVTGNTQRRAPSNPQELKYPHSG